MTTATATTTEAPTMDTIERATKDYADARAELRGRMESLQQDIDAIKRRRMQGLRNSLVKLTAAGDGLRNLLEDHPELFERPKTRTFHGIRVGWMKQKGKIEFDEPDQVVALIRKQFPDQADALITVKETPTKKALANLTGTELKRIGVRVTADTEAVVIKATDSELDKMIDALLAESDEQL